jgi:hypothetical protein
MFATALLLSAATAMVSATYNVCAGLTGMPVRTSAIDVLPFSSDWGGVSVEEPACVAVPSTIQDVSRVIKYARFNGLFVSVRGNGHSTGGHTLNRNNIVLDMSLFDDVTVNSQRTLATAGAGAFWLDVVNAALAVIRRPAAVVDTISETTVGGVLALGGTSAIAFTTGVVVDAIDSFDAVDGKGNVYTFVSPTHDKTLFAAARGGLGQFAVITHVRIRLVPLVPVSVPEQQQPPVIDQTGGGTPELLSHTIAFASDAAFANYVRSLPATESVDGADIISLKNDPDLFDAVFGAAGASIRGALITIFGGDSLFFHLVNVIDFAPTNPALVIPPQGGAPIATNVFTWQSYAFRNLGQFGRARTSLAWYLPKVTRTVFVPHDERASDLVTKILTLLQRNDFYEGVPACQLSLKLIDTSLVSDTTLFRVPRLTRHVLEIGTVCLDDLRTQALNQFNPSILKREQQDEVDTLIRTEATRNWGLENVKAYSWNSQWECWHDHFGKSWPVVVALKQRFDPCAILNRGVGIFPQQRTRACSAGIDQPFECTFGSESSSDTTTTIDSDATKHLRVETNALNVDVSSLD